MSGNAEKDIVIVDLVRAGRTLAPSGFRGLSERPSFHGEKMENGEKRPSGASLRWFSIMERKGLVVLA